MDEREPATRVLMACLGEPSRFRLVQALIGGARCVTDLAGEVGLSQSCTTRHLQALERRDVVTGARDGKRVLYRLRDERADLMPLIGWAMQEGPLAPAARRRTRRVGNGTRPNGANGSDAAPDRSPRAPADGGLTPVPGSSPAREPAGDVAEEPTRPKPRQELEDFLL